MTDWEDRVVDSALQELHGSKPPDLSARVLLALREAAPGPLPRLAEPSRRRGPTFVRATVAAALFAAATWFVLDRFAGPSAAPDQVIAHVAVDVAIGELAWTPAGHVAPALLFPGRSSGHLVLAPGTRLHSEPASIFSLGTFGDLSTRPFTELEVKTMEFRKEHGVVAATFLTLGVVTGGVAWQALGRNEVATAGEVVRLESNGTNANAVAENAQLKQRIAELEQRLAAQQSNAARSDVTPSAAKVQPDAPKPATAEPVASSMLFTDPKYAEALAGIDWAQMGAVTNEMAPLLAELVAAMGKEGAEVPMDLAIKIQQLNSKLLAGVPTMLKAGLPGFGPNGTYTHPLVVANTLANTLAAAGQSLTPAQQRTLEGLVKVFSSEAQGIADSSRTFSLEQMLAETEMKDRFFKEIGSQLTPEQAAAMNPKGAGKYDGSSLFSAGLMTQAHAQPIPARDAAEFARVAGGRIADRLGLDEATAAQVRTLLAQASASPELWQDRGDATETSLRMMRSGRTQAALRNQLHWMQQIQQQVNLTPEQREKLAKMNHVLVPLPR